MKIQIKCCFSNKVLFEHDTENNTLCLTLEEGVKAGASLRGANLDGANLDGANLDDGSKLVGERPIIQIGPIGSRCAYFVAYITDQGSRLRAGCFFGTRAEFEARLANSDARTQKEYRAALAMINVHEELWK